MRTGARLVARRARGLILPDASVAAFDPATLSASLWVRASYGGVPWSGVSSAGSSGGRNLVAGTAPSVGSALNGLTPAAFNGSTQFLVNALTIDQLFSTAYDLYAAVNMAALGANASPFDEPAIIADSGGNWGLHVSTSGARLYHFNGSALTTSRVAITTATWTLIRARWDGTNMTIAINGNALGGTQAAGAPIGMSSGTIRVGSNYNGAALLNGSLAELVVYPSNLSAGNITNLRGYFSARYGISV